MGLVRSAAIRPKSFIEGLEYLDSLGQGEKDWQRYQDAPFDTPQAGQCRVTNLQSFVDGGTKDNS